MTREEQKKEALNRLRMLNLHNNVAKELEANDMVYYSDPVGVLLWLDNNEEYVKLVKDFEKEYDAYVYHCILTPAPFGLCLSMLYVSQYEEEWEMDRDDLKDGYPIAYVANLDDPECSEIGSIGIKERWGGLVRVA